MAPTTLRHYLLHFKKFLDHVESTELRCVARLSAGDFRDIRYTVDAMRLGNVPAVREHLYEVLQKKSGVYVIRTKAMLEHPGNTKSYQNNVKMHFKN